MKVLETKLVGMLNILDQWGVEDNLPDRFSNVKFIDSF